MALVGFAFAQLAIAAYACPLGAVERADPAHETCAGHAQPADHDGGPLCEAHCEGQSGVPGGNAPLVVPPPALAPFPFVAAPDPQVRAIAQAARSAPDANAAAPPVAQRFCRLLI